MSPLDIQIVTRKRRIIGDELDSLGEYRDLARGNTWRVLIYGLK
jgi:hypothetical protein